VENDFFDWPTVLVVGQTFTMKPAKVYFFNNAEIAREPLAESWKYLSANEQIIKVNNGHTLQAVGAGETTLTLQITTVKQEGNTTTTYTTKWTTTKKIAVANQRFVLADQLQRTPEQVKWQYELLKPLHQTGTYVTVPNSQSPFSHGQLTPGFLQDGLRMANFIRYLAGLPNSLELDGTLNQQAMHGAVLNAAWNKLDHTPAKPSSMTDAFYQIGYRSTTTSNLSSGISKLDEQVRGFMDDLGLNNVQEVGHRRWILNPGLKKIGFGMAKSTQGNFYGTMQVFDQSSNTSTQVEYDAIAWPAASHFPVEFFAKDAIWSVSLNPDLYDRSKISAIKVRVSKNGNAKTWTLDSSDQKVTTNEEYFRVSTQSIGIPFAVLFRPANAEIKHGDVFQVKIEGLQHRSLGTQTLNYQVHFFALDQVTLSNVPQYRSQSEVNRTPSMQEMRIFINTQQKIYDQPPMTVNGSVLVPMRGIVENLGASVQFESSTQTITAQKGTRKVTLRIGQNTAKIDGRDVGLSQAAISKNGRLYVPLRFISEAFAAEVSWQSAYRAVMINFSK
jgi:uncharacterized protein YkwD